MMHDAWAKVAEDHSGSRQPHSQRKADDELGTDQPLLYTVCRRMAESDTVHPNAQLLLSATSGFDYLFSNDIDSARTHFQRHHDPFHLLGTGICAFLEAALGMEVCNKPFFILRDETMLCYSWVSWRKRRAALSCRRLAHDNKCELQNLEI